MLNKAYLLGASAALSDFFAKKSSVGDMPESDVADAFVRKIEEIQVGIPDGHLETDHAKGNERSASGPSTERAVSWSSPRVLKTGRP